MKKALIVILTICVLLNAHIVYANEDALSVEVCSNCDIRSAVDNHGIPISEIIQQAINYQPENLEWHLEALFEKEDSYSWDTSKYLTLYSISLDALQAIADGTSVDTFLADQSVVIFVPVTGSKDGAERLVGYIYFYDERLDKPAYDIRVASCAFWIDGTEESPFDKLDLFNNYESVKQYFPDCEIQEMIHLRINSIYSWLLGSVLLVRTNNGMQILDYGNVAQNPDATTTCVYSIEEFISHRTAYEEKIQQANNGMVFRSNGPLKAVSVSILVISCAAIIGLLLFRQKKLKLQKAEANKDIIDQVVAKSNDN